MYLKASIKRPANMKVFVLGLPMAITSARFSACGLSACAGVTACAGLGSLLVI